MSDQEQTPFTEFLAGILDTERPVLTLGLAALSRLSENELKQLADAWERIELDRRRSLVSSLEFLAEDDLLFVFDGVGKIALKDTDHEVRTNAIRLTALEEDPDFAPVLIDLVDKDPHFEVRAEAATALGKFVYLGEIEEISNAALRQVEDALLLAFREDEQVLVRRRALEAISFSSRESVTGMIQDAYNSDDEDWQVSALFSMGASANQRWEKQVVESLSSSSAALRSQAARAAGKLDLKDTAQDLMDLAEHDTDDEVRLSAVWALSDIGGARASEFIENLLDEAESPEDIEFFEAALENLLESQMFDEFDLPFMEISEDDLRTHLENGAPGDDEREG